MYHGDANNRFGPPLPSFRRGMHDDSRKVRMLYVGSLLTVRNHAAYLAVALAHGVVA